jgi:hypothetical protein
MAIESLIATSSKSNQINFAGYRFTPKATADTDIKKQSELAIEIESERYKDYWKQKLFGKTTDIIVCTSNEELQAKMYIDILAKRNKDWVISKIDSISYPNFDFTSIKTDADAANWFSKNGNASELYDKVFTLPCGKILVGVVK